VSVRAANGTAYATMQNFVTVGATFDYQGEGNAGAYFSGGATGTQNTIITGVNSVGSETNAAVAVYGPTIGPFSSHNKYRIDYTAPIPANRFTQQSTGVLAEGATNFNQAFFNASGGMGVGENNQVFPGISSMVAFLGNQPQTQTIGIGNGSQAAFCSSSIYCNVAASGIGSAGSGQLYYNAAGLTGATITGSVATAGGVSTLTVGAMVTGAIEPGLILSGAGVSGSPTLTACTANCPTTTAAGGSEHDLDLEHEPGDDRIADLHADPGRRRGVAERLSPSRQADGPERRLWRLARQVRHVFAQRERNASLLRYGDLFLYAPGGPMHGRRDRKLVHQLCDRRLRHRVLVAAGGERDHSGVMDQPRQPQRDAEGTSRSMMSATER
jgi:hypothetical protein